MEFPGSPRLFFDHIFERVFDWFLDVFWEPFGSLFRAFEHQNSSLFCIPFLDGFFMDFGWLFGTILRTVFDVFSNFTQ